MNEIEQSDSTHFMPGKNANIAVGSQPGIDALETADYGGGEVPLSELNISGDLQEVLNHLDDARPVVTWDPSDAEMTKARYIIGKEIGRGAIGQVIEAYDQHLSRRVAIKILNSDAEVSRDRLARFIAEAQITGQLEHPTIVPVHEIGMMPGGMPYIAMKLVKGESLEDIINKLRVGDQAYLDYYAGKHLIRTFYRICQGVAYAHSRGVIHRDLKPANILVGEYGEVKIMDWGLAKILSDSPVTGVESVQTVRDAPDMVTMDGAIAGTPAYMSPEQARGHSEHIGTHSDVFCLGLILAEFVTLFRVFRGHSSGDTLKQVKSTNAININDLNPNAKVDPELAAIVRKCTMQDISRRYPTANELVEDLRTYLEDRSLEISPDISTRKVVKWGKRNPFLAGMVTMLGLFFAAQAVWNFVRSLL